MPKAEELYNNRDTSIDEEAYKNRITSYYRLNDNNAVKATLLEKYPVICSIAWGSGSKYNKEDGMVHFSTKKDGGHCVLLVGWNEKGWIIQNSWGEDWGDKGTAILPYEYEIKEAWGLTLANQPKDNTIVKPKFNFIRRVLQIIIEVIKALLNKGGNI